MTIFHVKPIILEFSNVDEFLEHFPPGANHLLLTNRYLFDRYFDRGFPWEVLIYEDYGLGEPSDLLVDAMLTDIAGKDIQRVVAIGGGSVLDVAKLLCVKGARSVRDIFDDLIPLTREREMILVPTTCGTGCEMTCVSVVDYSERNSKIGKRIEANFADYAVLIPTFLEGLPEAPFLYSSVDALIHALEIYLAPGVSHFSAVYCEEAIRVITGLYRRLSVEGIDRRAAYLSDFLRASCYAGIALSNTVCGAVHALAMVFGSMYHASHGESNYLFLFAALEKYARLCPEGKINAAAELVADASDRDPFEAFTTLRKLLGGLFPRKSLLEYGLKPDDMGELADRVLATQQRLLVNSYTPLGREDLLDIIDASRRYSEEIK